MQEENYDNGNKSVEIHSNYFVGGGGGMGRSGGRGGRCFGQPGHCTRFPNAFIEINEVFSSRKG